MLEFDFLKRLGIEKYYDKIDCSKSYAFFDPNTNNLIIELFLNKDYCRCELCGSTAIKVQKTFISPVKTQTAEAANATVHVHRRTFVCENQHSHRQENPFKIEGNKFTIQKDIAILNDLRDMTNTYTHVAKKYQVSPTYVMNLFDKRVDLKRLTLPPVLCIDEVYGRKLTRKGYCFVLYSPQRRKIIDILDSRKKLDLIDYFSRISQEEKNCVLFVSMDLYEIYRDVIEKCFPHAIICADPFHVVKHLIEGFENVRKRVMHKYDGIKNEGHNYYWLYKKFKWMLLKDPANIKDVQYKVSKSGMIMSKHQIIHCMLQLDETLDLAYNLMMIFRNYIATATIDDAKEKLDIIITQFKEAHIKEYANFIRILNNWHDQIINSFNTINGHKITNGPMERVNKDIKTIIRISFGSSNFQRMRNRIMFCINGDAPILGTRKEKTYKRSCPPRGKYNKKNKQ